MRKNLFDFKCEELTISRSITDTKWSFSITIDKDYPYPDLWEPVHAIKEVDGTQHCLFIGFPTSKQKVIRDGDEYIQITGNSYGWYLANRPLRPAERLLKTTVTGKDIVVEDPITYLERLIFGSNVVSDYSNPCGLIKGNWDTSTNNWGTSTLPGVQFEANESATIQTVLDDISDYANLIHYDYWKKIGPDWQAVSYLVNESNLDTNMDLPSPLTITSSDEQIDARTHNMLEDIQFTSEGEKWKNRIIVDAKIQGADTYYTAMLPETWDIAENGLERIYQCCEELPPKTKAADATNWAKNRAAALYSLLCTPTTTFEVQFWYKYDLKLFQKIQFFGFANISDEVMRISELSYRFSDADGDMLSVRCSLDREWSSARKLAFITKMDHMAFTESINKIIDKRIQTTFLATITDVTDGAAIYQSVAGRAGYAATPNQ